jgi:hypothetical protein
VQDNDAEEKAHRRFVARCEAAKWKYCWEMASIEAARIASAQYNSNNC